MGALNGWLEHKLRLTESVRSAGNVGVLVGRDSDAYQ